jgi:hypothetical protein
LLFQTQKLNAWPQHIVKESIWVQTTNLGEAQAHSTKFFVIAKIQSYLHLTLSFMHVIHTKHIEICTLLLGKRFDVVL